MASAAHVREDETIVCVQCERPFLFTVDEQALYEQRGYQNKPKRCSDCRSARKNGLEPKPLTEEDLLIETCRAVGSLRVYVERQFREVNERLDFIEQKISNQEVPDGQEEERRRR